MISSGRLPWVSSPHRLKHKSRSLSALQTLVVKSVFSLRMCRPSPACQPCGALRAASCCDLHNRGTTGALKWCRGFSFALQKAIGIEEAPLWPGKSRFYSGSLGLSLLCLRDGGKKEGGGCSHVLPKSLSQSLVTNVKVICEPKGGKVVSWWVGNVVAVVAAPGYHH